MNPWKEALGCEVNVCAAKECNQTRMSFCALRKAYLERVAYVKQLRNTTRIEWLRDKYNDILKGLEADE